jgi:hypothetical protein
MTVSWSKAYNDRSKEETEGWPEEKPRALKTLGLGGVFRKASEPRQG